MPRRASAQSIAVSQVEYDIECRLRFGRVVEEPLRRALKDAVEGKHAAWYTARPVVAWTDTAEAVVFLVVRGSPDTAPILCRDAEARVRDWARRAGLTDSPTDGMTVECAAIPRA
jgi:hypothetical protein